MGVVSGIDRDVMCNGVGRGRDRYCRGKRMNNVRQATFEPHRGCR